MLCALHTILVLVTMRLGCDASTLAKALLHVLHTCTHTCKVAWTLACVLLASTDVARLAVACTRAACLPERSRRARRAGVHARCFGLASLDVHHVDVALLSRHKTTSEMRTSEMTTSETSQTSEKKYQTNACACGSRTARPRDQDSEQEPSKAPGAEKPQEMCRSLRYTNELSETSKASEKKHEASGCACELQDPQAHETKSARLGPRAQESDQEHPSAADRSCAHLVPPGSGRRRPRCSPTRR